MNISNIQNLLTQRPGFTTDCITFKDRSTGQWKYLYEYTPANVQTGLVPLSDNIENFLGASPMENPRLYFEASSINYATVANNQIGVFLSVGTEDDLVNRAPQTDAFLLALKQANFFVRPCIVQGAPHYWANDPIEEPGSFPGFVAPRLVRFLQERL